MLDDENEAASGPSEAPQLSDEVLKRRFTLVSLADPEAVTLGAPREEGSGGDSFKFWETFSHTSRCQSADLLPLLFLSSIFCGRLARRSGNLVLGGNM